MSAASALARGRVLAESLMVDTCVIRRVTGTSTDETSGVITPTYTEVYSGACRVQQRTATATRLEAGEASALMLALEVQVPMSVTGVQTEDEVTITTSVHDDDLADRAFLVKGLAHGTHKTARRLLVEERTS